MPIKMNFIKREKERERIKENPNSFVIQLAGGRILVGIEII